MMIMMIMMNHLGPCPRVKAILGADDESGCGDTTCSVTVLQPHVGGPRYVDKVW